MQSSSKRRIPSVWTRLRRVVAVPTGLMLVLWLCVSGYLAYDAMVKHALADGVHELSVPSGEVLTALGAERAAAAGYLADPSSGPEEYAEAVQETEERLDAMHGALEGLHPYVQDAVQQRVEIFAGHLDGLGELRERVEAEDIDPGDALEHYTETTTAGLDLFEAQVRDARSAAPGFQGLNGIEIARAIDHLTTADALLRPAFADDRLADDTRQEFTELMASHGERLESVAVHLGPEGARRWEELTSSEHWRELQGLAQEISGHEPPVDVDLFTGEVETDLAMPVPAEQWRQALAEVRHDLEEAAEGEASLASDLVAAEAQHSTWIAAAAGASLLGAVVLVSMLARRAAHRIAERVLKLRDDTRSSTQSRLPDLVEQISRGHALPDPAEPSPLAADTDEVGEVARSFDAAQQVALRAAAHQSELRHSANRAFVSLAHRSHSLVQRQLRILDKLEHEQEDPERLAELFKLNHLAARARRTTENLLILGREPLERSRTQPAPLMDVLRGAMAETGDYTRIDRGHAPRISVAGQAVPDLVHLVAELLDNATSYSPPHTRVHLSAVEAANGVAIEVEDRGAGMTDEQYSEANATLAHPAEFDVTDLHGDVRLGYIVVSRLAERHGVQVRLRPSPYGGVQAIVLLPASLLVPDAPQALELGTTSVAEDSASQPPVGETSAEPVVVSAASNGHGQEAQEETLGDPLPEGALLPRRTPRPATPRPGDHRVGDPEGTPDVEQGAHALSEEQRLQRMKAALAALHRTASPSPEPHEAGTGTRPTRSSDPDDEDT